MELRSQIITLIVTAIGIIGIWSYAAYHKSKQSSIVAKQEGVEAPTQGELLAKADRLPIRTFPMSPRPAQEEESSATPPHTPPSQEVVERPVPSDGSPPGRRHRASNVCERTGGRKVETRRSWHCEYRHHRRRK